MILALLSLILSYYSFCKFLGQLMAEVGTLGINRYFHFFFFLWLIVFGNFVSSNMAKKPYVGLCEIFYLT